MKTHGPIRRRLSTDGGITLLEVMIAMVILSVSLLLLLNMGMVALDANDWSNKTTMAVQAMQQKMEQLRTESSPQSGADTVNGMSRSWTVTTAGSYLREISVSVSWEDIKGIYHTNTISSMIRTDSL